MVQKIEGWLYRRGFTVPGVRRMVVNQFVLCAASCILALATAWFWRWTRDFAIGAVLATVNFYAMARFVQDAVYMKKGAVVPLLVSFYGRLILTALVLFALIVWVNISVIALGAGFITILASLLYKGKTRGIGQKAKEA